MNKKLVSIIIPTYMRADMLNRAIDSVLNQTYDNIEVIIVDDNNPHSKYRKNTEEIMLKYKEVKNVMYLKHDKNRNGAAARNTGINAAKGEYIGFLDDDDEFISNKIEAQVNSLNKISNEYGAVYGGYRIIRGNKVISNIEVNKEGQLFQDLMLMEWGTGSGSNVLFKREVFNEIGLFDESLLRHQDWDILLRMFKKYKIKSIEDIIINIYKDSRINIPNAEKFNEVKTYFLNKYENELFKMSDELRNKIYQRHNLELVSAYLRNRNYIVAKEKYKISSQYYKVDWKKKISLFLVFIFVNMPFKNRVLVSCGKIIERFRLVKS